MNDEEIDIIKKKRETPFWEFLLDRKNVLILAMLSLFLFVGCQPISYGDGTTIIPKPHNLSLMGNSSGIVELTQLVNTNLMDGYFGTLILIAVFIISFMAITASTGSSTRAFATSSFITFLITIPLRGMELIENNIIYVALAMVLFSIAFLMQRD